MRFLSLVFLLAFSLFSFEVKAGALSVVEGYIHPSFQALQGESFKLEETMKALCKTPSNNNLEKAQDAFKKTALSYARIEILRFGPLIQNNRFERLYFWPDRRGLALKRLRQALIKQDETLLKVENLREKSIAFQGLGALEFLLFDKTSNKILEHSFHCSLTQTIASLFHQTVNETVNDWQDEQGFLKDFLNPQENSGLFRSQNEVETILFNVLKNGFESLVRLKLQAPLGTEIKKAKPKRGALWRSELTLLMMSENIAALLAFQEKSKILKTLPEQKNWMEKQAEFEMQGAVKILSEVRKPWLEAVIDEKDRQRLLFIKTAIESLVELYGQEIGPSLGISAGFNALDGD